MKLLATYYSKIESKFLRYTFSNFKEFFNHLNENNEVELYRLDQYVKDDTLEKSIKDSYIKLIESDPKKFFYIINPSKIQGDIEVVENENDIYKILIIDRNIFNIILDIQEI